MNDEGFGWASMVTLIIIIGIAASLLLPTMRLTRGQPYEKRCVNHLKQMGVGMAMYFSDGTEKYMPYDSGTIKANAPNSWYTLFELDKSNLKCPAKRSGRTKNYSIHPDASNGVALSSIEFSDSAIAGDTTRHIKGRKSNILYGDGHVSPFHLAIMSIDNNNTLIP